MADEEWIKTLADGRKVKFAYQELPEDGAFMTAQLAGTVGLNLADPTFIPIKERRRTRDFRQHSPVFKKGRRSKRWNPLAIGAGAAPYIPDGTCAFSGCY